MRNPHIPPTGMTPEQYFEFVETHGHTPSQDPIYDHRAGSPTQRTTIDQVRLIEIGDLNAVPRLEERVVDLLHRMNESS